MTRHSFLIRGQGAVAAALISLTLLGATPTMAGSGPTNPNPIPPLPQSDPLMSPVHPLLCILVIKIFGEFGEKNPFGCLPLETRRRRRR